MNQQNHLITMSGVTNKPFIVTGFGPYASVCDIVIAILYAVGFALLLRLVVFLLFAFWVVVAGKAPYTLLVAYAVTDSIIGCIVLAAFLVVLRASTGMGAVLKERWVIVVVSLSFILAEVMLWTPHGTYMKRYLMNGAFILLEIPSMLLVST